jgi:glycogen operon protein
MYSEAAADSGREEDCFIYCAYNAHWEKHSFELPIIPAGLEWAVVLNSADEQFRDFGKVPKCGPELSPRSCIVLCTRKKR